MTSNFRRGHEWQRRLSASHTPLFLIDADRRIRAFNDGCVQLTGWSAEDVLGQECPYASPPDAAGVAALAGNLCPPPEVLRGVAAVAPARLILKNGKAVPQSLHFVPLLDGDGQVTVVIGVVLPALPIGVLTPAPAHELHAELAGLRAELRQRFALTGLIARSDNMRLVVNQVQLAQHCLAGVLIHGEAGTGKEHLARTVHFGGLWKGNWFVPLDCQALNADELEQIVGRLLELHRASPRGTAGPQPGTLYLAHVENLPRDLQQRIATAWSEPHEPSLRLLAGTTLSPNDLRGDDRLRPDFWSMVSTITIALPPLRERFDDLPLLAQHFLEESNRHAPNQLGGFSDETWDLLHAHDWPGNLDELYLVVQAARQDATGPLVTALDLPFRFRTGLAASQMAPATVDFGPISLDEVLLQVETQLIRLALDRCRENKTRAADLLGINRPRLYRRMQQLGIADPDLPPEAPSVEAAGQVD